MVNEDAKKLYGSVEKRIKESTNIFTKSEKMLVEKITSMDKKSIIYLSITELADLVGVAEATIVRFCHKLDYNGYQDFKLHLSQEISKTKNSLDDIPSSVAHDMIEAINESKDAIDLEVVKEVAAAIVNAKRVYLYAFGNSYISATTLRYALIKVGINVVGEVDSHIQTFTSANSTRDDLALFISVSGSTKDLITIARNVKKNATQIVAITNHFKSPLVHLADYALFSSRHEAANKGGSIATIVSQQYMVSVLIDAIVEYLGETAIKNMDNSSIAVSDKLY